MSLDFFTLPTATFRVLFVFIVLRHDRRRIVHFNVTEHPSAEWTAQQMVDAFPWDTAPRYLVRDRDQTYGAYFDTRVDGLGIEQVLTAPRSPWQNPLVERMIGSIRRECLDHVIVLSPPGSRGIPLLDGVFPARTGEPESPTSPPTRPRTGARHKSMTIETARRAGLEFVCVFGQDEYRAMPRRLHQSTKT